MLSLACAAVFTFHRLACKTSESSRRENRTTFFATFVSTRSVLELRWRQSTRRSVESAAPVRGIVLATHVRLAVLLRQNACVMRIGDCAKQDADVGVV